jgi:RHS repeat-associated protein
MLNMTFKQRLSYGRRRNNFTVKELDAETGLYYYGARYLDPKTSRWLSGDPAMGEYLPVAPVNDEAKKHNGNLPGMGGVFNYVNLHAYHYAGNNPVKYTDPDGEEDVYILYTYTSSQKDQDMKAIERESMDKHIDKLKKYGFTVKVIEKATKDDVLAAFKDSEAKLIYVSGHGAENTAAIQTNNGLFVSPNDIKGAIPGTSELTVVIFQACYQGNTTYKKAWQAALDSRVEFVGWRKETYAETSRSFNGIGIFSGKLKNMNMYIDKIIQGGRKYIDRPG